MPKYFGTDGFRGEAGVNLTADHAFRIGRFLGDFFRQKNRSPVRVVIGKDTRRSCYTLEHAVAAGLTASGADAYLLHVTTTPCVSFVTAADGFDCGIMISASHNPYYDNGIKLVNRLGEKMEDDVLDRIEAYLDGKEPDVPFAKRDRIGKVMDYSAGRDRYIDHLLSASSHSFGGLRIALDCANGSAFAIAKRVFEALGAETTAIGTEPNGLNINENVGSTHIETLAAYAKEHHPDVCFAFDGDADRCLAVDEQGNVVNGDHILYIFAEEMARRGTLVNNTVVTTVMSNMGLYRALDRAGIRYVQTKVGDKFVYENMQETGNCVGGEQSGHIILKEYATTGDGILTAIKLTDVMLDCKMPLSRLASPVVMYPQVLINLRVRDKSGATHHPAVTQAVAQAAETLGTSGRILLRESGTEPVVRVMVEAPDRALCERTAQSVANVIRSTGLTVEE